MATSDNHGLTNRPGERDLSLQSLTHYDLLLAVIPTVFLTSLLVGQVLSLSTHVSMAGAGLIGALAVADALFVHPPRDLE